MQSPQCIMAMDKEVLTQKLREKQVCDEKDLENNQYYKIIEGVENKRLETKLKKKEFEMEKDTRASHNDTALKEL